MKKRWMIGALGGLAAMGAVAQADVAYMVLDSPIIERDPTGGGFFSDPDERTLRQFVRSIEHLGEREDIDGLVLRVRSGFAMKGTQVEEVGVALESLSASGIPVHIFSDSYGPLEVLLASYADEVLMQRGGSVMAPRIYFEELFLADAMRKIGLEPSFVQIGDYKGASEMMANAEPSEAWEENVNGLLDEMYAHMTGQLSDGYELSARRVELALREAFWADGASAIEVGLLDAELDRMELREHLEGRYGVGFRFDDDVWLRRGSGTPDFESMNPFQAFSTLMQAFASDGQPVRTTRDTIALVYVDGAIIDGDSSQGGLFGGSSVGSTTIRKALSDIERDDNIKGVVVRIDSPGGSAIASEIIWQGVRRVSEAGKPVWVSVGSMAASGGYYIAVAGDRIYANHGSVVGSIGVVGGKIAMGGLYDKMGINVVPRARGPHAELMSSISVWDERQRETIAQMMTDTYDLFVERVELGREGIDIDAVGEGRLFLGERARHLGMIDGIGGVDSTIDGLASELRLVDGAFDVIEYPAPLTLEELLSGAFPFASAEGAAPVASAMREVLGDRAWNRVGTAARALMELRDQPVVLTVPSVLIER